MSAQASAPGKLVLLGEYAVLEGAPALVAAVDRRAQVRIEPSSGGVCELRAAQVSAEPARFVVTPAGRVSWQADAVTERYRLFTFVLERLIADGSLAPGKLGEMAVSLDSHGFFQGGRKLGLGSSAALTVALSAALLDLAGANGTRGALPALGRLIDIHTAFQHGHGSGLDVAASLTGGVITFERDPDTGAARVEAVSWPADLHLLCLWTGRAASTGRLLGAVENARQRSPRTHAAHMARLVSRADRGRDAVRGGDAGRLLGAIAAYADALEEFGTDCEIEITGAGHRQLGQLARAAGAVYKPSGAGGGDIGLAFAIDPGRLTDLRSAAAHAGFVTVELEVGAPGLERA